MAQTELPTAVFETFQRSPLSSELLAPGILPGAGKITCDKLIKREITSAVALMGYYLLLNRNNDAFISFLVATDVQKRYAEKIALALEAKSHDYCTDAKHDTSPAKKADGSTTTVFENFERMRLSMTKLTPGVVPGIGEASIPRVQRRMKAKMGEATPKQTPTPVQLLGLYLAMGRSQTAFIEWLTGECKCQERHAERTCEALERKAESICDRAVDTDFASPSKARAPGLPPTPEERGGEPREETLEEMKARSADLWKTLLYVLLLLAAGSVVVHLTVGFNFSY